METGLMVGRRLRVQWAQTDTVAAVRQAYRAEPDGSVRMRLQGLWLLRSGRRVGEVAAVLGVHYRTVQRWVRWYEQGGLAAVQAHHQGGAGPTPKLTSGQQEQVGQAVATGRFRTSADIGVWIADTFGVPYRPGGVQALLKRLRCAPNVPRPLHTQADPEAQAQWKKGGSRPPWRRPA